MYDFSNAKQKSAVKIATVVELEVSHCLQNSLKQKNVGRQRPVAAVILEMSEQATCLLMRPQKCLIISSNCSK